MTQPTLSDYFGLGAEVLTAETPIAATADNPYLVIPFSGLVASGLSDPAKIADPDCAFAAMLKLVRIFTASDTDEESGIEVGAPRKGFANRGLTNTQKLSFDYSVTVYLPDTTDIDFDPDQVV